MPHSQDLTDEAHQPWSAQIELTEGCSRLCGYCGLNAIRDKPGNFKFMTISTAEQTAMELADLCPNARYEFAMHGEPLMNPEANAIFAIFRSYLPKAQLMVTTNGARFRQPGTMGPRAAAIFDAGIDFIVLDTYEPERAELVAEAMAVTTPGVRVVDFYKDLAPAGVNVYKNHKGTLLQRTIVLMDDIGLRDGEHPSRVLLNHAGSNPLGPIPPAPKKATCTNPFREITVTWDGEVRICCMDWKGEHPMGNITTATGRAIWYGERFNAARAMLQSKDRSFQPCDVCDKGPGTRPGLLPRWSPPTEAQRALVPKRQTPHVRPRSVLPVLP